MKTFKKMKDYILGNRDLIGQREILQLSMETANNRIEINKINSDMLSLEKQISDVAEGMKDVVTKSKSSIYVVDNYIGLRMLVHLKNSPTGVDIILFSDNVGNNKLHNIEFTDFCKEYPTVKIKIE